MTREEAVIILDGFKNNPLFSDTHVQAFDMAISALKESIDESWIFSDIEKAPTIDACEMAISALSEIKSEWIPISERLPESDGYYLVTEKSGRVCTYVFHKEGNSEEYWKRCAIAWMPLPSPWKGE